MGKGDLTPHLIQHQRKRLVNLPAVIADISGGDRIFRLRMSFELSAVGILHLGTTLIYQQRAFAGEKVIEIEGARESSTYTFEQAVG